MGIMSLSKIAMQFLYQSLICNGQNTSLIEMKLIAILIFISFFHLHCHVRANKLFKRLTLNANRWQRFVHKRIEYDVNTLIECGGHCNYHDSQCDLFVFMKDTLTCHIGTFANVNTNFLSGFTGDHHLHFSFSNDLLMMLFQICTKYLVTLLFRQIIGRSR